jgi:AsmA family
MARLDPRVLIGTGVVAAVVVVVAVCVAVVPDVNRYKPSLEEAVSQALGMEFEIRGNVALRLFPHPGLSMRDIHLTKGTSEILSAEELQVSPRWIPLILHRRLSIGRLALRKPRVRLEQPIAVPLPAGRMSSVTVQDGEVSYLDQGSGRRIDITGLEVRLAGISVGASDERQPLARLTSLSLRGTLHATTVQVGSFRADDVQCGVKAEAGVLQLDPVAVTLFGAPSVGSLALDVRGSPPRIQVAATSQVDLGQVFPGDEQYFAGTVQASLQLGATGADLRAVRSTAGGVLSIRGEHLSVRGWDVDRLIEDYNRTQKFSLIDLGAVLVAGPFGPLLTKGSDFARLYGGMGHGESDIPTLVSDWEIVDGIATAKDVAFSTLKNTVAFRGDVNLVNDSLEHFFVATVDPHGCAQVKQQITGSLAHPHAPGLASKSIFGAIGSAVQGVLSLGQSDRCDLFYSGSALP